MDNIIFLGVIGALLVLAIIINNIRKKEREEKERRMERERDEYHQALMIKYSDSTIVDAIIACKVWCRHLNNS